MDWRYTITPGKSNVMDALSFALGERAAALRVKHLRDLVHGAHIGQPVSSTASVALRYCDEEDREVVFGRTVTGQYLPRSELTLHISLQCFGMAKSQIAVLNENRKKAPFSANLKIKYFNIVSAISTINSNCNKWPINLLVNINYNNLYVIKRY